MKNKTAILIDGAFFLKRYLIVYNSLPVKDVGKIVAKKIYEIVKNFEKKFNFNLYRIFYYDAQPFLEKAHNPIYKKSIDFSKSEQALFRNELFSELKQSRKVALRLGEIRKGSGWLIKPDKTKQLLSGKIATTDLVSNDVFYELRQKSVDLKIGLDIATLTYKKLVDQIILISGDSDFDPRYQSCKKRRN